MRLFMERNRQRKNTVFSSRQKVVRDSAQAMSSSIRNFGVASGNALLPTVCHLTEGTARRSELGHNRVRFVKLLRARPAHFYDRSTNVFLEHRWDWLQVLQLN